MKNSSQTPLSNVQQEILKVFANDIPEEDLKELKKVMARFLLNKARMKADKIWEERGYSDEKLKKLIDEQ